jgi:hypothetical protein
MEINIEVDDRIHDLLAARASANGFDSAEEYASTIVETVVEELETETVDEVSERLEDLGYL